VTRQDLLAYAVGALVGVLTTGAVIFLAWLSA
jgi:hypothetical protein